MDGSFVTQLILPCFSPLFLLEWVLVISNLKSLKAMISAAFGGFWSRLTKMTRMLLTSMDSQDCMYLRLKSSPMFVGSLQKVLDL